MYPSPDIYYKLTPNPLIESVTASLCGSSFDTFLSVVDMNGNVIASKYGFMTNNTEALGTRTGTVNLVAGEYYPIQLMIFPVKDRLMYISRGRTISANELFDSAN